MSGCGEFRRFLSDPLVSRFVEVCGGFSRRENDSVYIALKALAVFSGFLGFLLVSLLGFCLRGMSFGRVFHRA